MDSATAAALAVEHLNTESGTSWALAARLAGGVNSGAWRIEAADGSVAVLKPALSRDWAEQMLRADDALRSARDAGYPVPRWLAAAIIDTGIGYHVEELLPGTQAPVIGTTEARLLIAVLERQRGLDPDPARCWTDYLAEQLGPGRAALVRAVTRIGPAGSALVSTCERLLASGTHGQPRDDLVHGDFRLGNILFNNGRVSGVIDTEAVGSGSRVFDYATLLDETGVEPDAVALLVEMAVSIAGPVALRACFAYVALDLARFLASATWFAAPDLSERIKLLTERATLIERLTHRHAGRKQ